MTIGEFAEAVVLYCGVTNASEIGGRRTPLRNGVVGGVEHSAHLAGLARDVNYDNELPKAHRQQWAGALGLRIIFEDDHDHLQPLNWPAG
jgi:hypothetical protein